MRSAVFYFLILIGNTFLFSKNYNAIDIMERVNSSPKPNSSISEIELEIVKKKRDRTKSKSRSFLRYEKRYTTGGYKKKTLVKFLKPNSVSGTSLLSWIKNNGSSEQWFYIPKLKVSKKVKSKERSKSFMSTDFIYEDLETRHISDDVFSIEGQSKVDDNDCVVLLSKPIKESYYHYKKIYVDEKIWQIRKVEFYSSEKGLIKTLFLKEIMKKGEYWFPSIMEMITINGNYTNMKIIGFKPGVVLDDEIFTESFLVNMD